ncbi:AMP-binding enzyme, partial [Piscirickettsia litoralis]
MGFFKTGDIGYIDDKGFVYLVDRLKDMVLVSGFNVYPAEIEDIISQMPGVKEVAVIGVPCKHSGEAIKAFIIPTPGFHLTQESVRAYCKERVTAYKVPKLVEFCQDLPKSN